MKNIHIILTDKPSRLYEDVDNDLQLGYDFIVRQGMLQNQNIYITNSEEIQVNDYITDGYLIWKWKDDSSLLGRKKIILTTDQSLDGVQAIDNDFLEWFVKNPSCERVEVISYLKDITNPLTNEKYPAVQHRYFDETKMIFRYHYKIIIPKEEPKKVLTEEDVFNQRDIDAVTDYINRETSKQETLEEVAEIFVKNRFTKQICNDESYPDIYASKAAIVESHILFAKWQQERMYSEEEVIELLEYARKNFYDTGTKWHSEPDTDYASKELIEQFKKK